MMHYSRAPGRKGNWNNLGKVFHNFAENRCYDEIVQIRGYNIGFHLEIKNIIRSETYPQCPTCSGALKVMTSMQTD